MTRWQRSLRLVLAVFVIAFAAVVYLAMRKPTPVVARPTVPPMEKRVVSKVSNGRLEILKGATIDCTIEYQTVLEYAGTGTEINGVKATFPQRDGRDLVVTGDHASINPDRTTFSITGNVHMSTSDGFLLNTDQASYAQGEGIVRAPGKVEFTRGAMHGTGVGMTYDQKQDILSLLDAVDITEQGGEGQPPSEAHSGTLVWPRRDSNMRLERNVRMVRGSQTLQSDVAMIYLADNVKEGDAAQPAASTGADPAKAAQAKPGDQPKPADQRDQHIQLIQMQGNSRITGAPANRPPGGQSAGGSTLRGMRARDIALTYAPDGQTLQQAVLAGGGSVEVASNGNGSVTRIAGEFVDFGFEADGSTMRSLGARGAEKGPRAELQLPPQGDAPPRVIRAVAIQGPTPGAPAQAGGGLTTLRFSDQVEYREMPKAPASPRVATARLLDLTVQPGLGAVEDARFSGNVRLTEGTSLEATARNAAYDVKHGTFDLTGTDDKGAPPQVKDQQQATVQADHIIVTPEGRRIAAYGAVQTIFQSAENGRGGSSVHTPAILDQSQPVYARSDELRYDGAASTARFRSKAKARLWQLQGGTAISAVQIDLDDSKGDLHATGTVASAMMLDQVDAKTKKKERVGTTVLADDLAYEDATRRATYTGHVQMHGGVQGNLKANKAVLLLTKDGRALETLDAYENVEVQDQGTETTGERTATGDTLRYTAADEQYVIKGKLVKINEKCFGETIGRTLIFFRSVDRMIVDGNTERRTQTKGTENKGGQGCKK